MINIITDEERIIMYLNDNKLLGYKFKNNNEVESIDESVLSYFDMFRLSNNYKELDSDGEYKVYLDNETNFKHYFKDGIEDYEMFFYNNGEEAVDYLGKGKIDIDRIFKRVSAFLIAIEISLSLEIFVDVMEHKNKIEIEGATYQKIEDLNLSDLKDKIYDSNLTDEEKEYIYNENFYNDILPYINKDEYNKYTNYYINFNNIQIISFEEENPRYNDSDGYVSRSKPNIIYLRDYNELLPNVKNHLSHENIHRCQNKNAKKYKLLTEATAEIISYEYFDGGEINTYFEPVRLTKKLMEIIGPEPIWDFVFTGNSSKIEENVKPYLTDKEYGDFWKFLMHSGNDEKSIRAYQNLDDLLSKLYNNFYNKDIEDDEIIYQIDHNSDNLNRFYFNKRLMTEENSYYLLKYIASKTISLDEAIKNGVVLVGSYSEKVEQIQTRYGVNYDKENIKLINKYIIDGTIYVTCIVNGVEYIDVKEADLIDNGILESTAVQQKSYIYQDYKDLTYEEYINHNYQGELKYSMPVGGSISGDIVTYFEAHTEKIYIPTILQRNTLERTTG